MRLPNRFSVASADVLLEKFSRKHYDGRKDNEKKTHFLSPFSDFHYDARFDNYKYKTVPKSRIWNIATVGVLILLMACINFINICSALATKRAKDVGVRKVLGSRKSQLVVQFLTETFLVVLVSLLIGLALAYASLPLLERLFDVPIDASLYITPTLGAYLLGLLLALTLLAGFIHR